MARSKSRTDKNYAGKKLSEGKTITGPEIIKAFVKNLPATPGVYRMFDSNSQVIYVGKARNLKARVSNYTRYEGNPVRTCRMISATTNMEFVHTNTEAEALLLEANMIKRLKPRYNVLMRDDKSFPYILIATDHSAPQLLKHRGARRAKGHYFGPFASPAAVERTIAALQKAFLLRNCSNSYFSARSRPCMQHQIKRCAAPCTGKITKTDYLELVEEARLFLAGQTKSVQQNLLNEMNKAAAIMDFERAAILRDRISALTIVQSQGGIGAKTVKEADIFAIHQQAGQYCVQVFFFRAFQNWGNHAFYPRADNSLSESEVLGPFITQFYQTRTPPKQILVSHQLEDHQLLESALSLQSEHKVKIIIPKRGEKLELVDHATLNAREALGRQLAKTSSQKKLLQGVAQAFGLKEMPRRIEVYDNSHISGTNAVGAMIVAGVEGLVKKHYRSFNIKSTTLTPGDDFAMMREVLGRRFSRLLRESPLDQRESPLDQRESPLDERESHLDKNEKKLPEGKQDNQELDDQKQETQQETQNDDVLPDWPDLLLIDGGKGQLSAVQKTLQELELENTIKLVAIAKGEERDAGRETFHIPGQKPFMLPARDPVLYFVQRLRDEAHRFAIGNHRARRKKQLVQNPLDQIEGIGPGRKRSLLSSFGSAKAISRAAIADIASVKGISKQLATKIYDHFNRAN